MNSVKLQNQYTEINCFSKHQSENEKKPNPIYNCIKKNKILRNKFNQGRERPAHWKLKDIEE